MDQQIVVAMGIGYGTFRKDIGRRDAWWQENISRGMITRGDRVTEEHLAAGKPDRGQGHQEGVSEGFFRKLPKGTLMFAQSSGFGLLGIGLLTGAWNYDEIDNVYVTDIDHRVEIGVHWLHYVLRHEDAISNGIQNIHGIKSLPGYCRCYPSDSDIQALIDHLASKPSYQSWYSTQQEPCFRSDEDEARYWAAVRKRDAEFREQILRNYDSTCAVTGCNVPQAVEAAHIIPHTGKRSDRADNGLCLRADIHKLFDSGLLFIDHNSYRVRIADELKSSQYADLEGRRIRLPADESARPCPIRLMHHSQGNGTRSKVLDLHHGQGH